MPPSEASPEVAAAEPPLEADHSERGAKIAAPDLYGGRYLAGRCQP